MICLSFRAGNHPSHRTKFFNTKFECVIALDALFLKFCRPLLVFYVSSVKFIRLLYQVKSLHVLQAHKDLEFSQGIQ